MCRHLPPPPPAHVHRPVKKTKKTLVISPHTYLKLLPDSVLLNIVILETIFVNII